MIIDFGSFSVRAGWASKPEPALTLDTAFLDAPSPTQASIASSARDIFLPLPPAAPRPRSLPLVRRGALTDLKALDLVSEQVAGKQIEADQRLMLVVPAGLSSKYRIELLRRALDLKFGAVAFARAPLMDLLAVGETTGLALDIGHGLAQTCCMIDGYVIDNRHFFCGIAGQEVTRTFAALLKKNGFVFKPGTEAEIIRTMKESFCECAPIGDKQGAAPPVRVTMPDGEDLLLGDERFQATEVLFSSSNGMTKKGIQGLAFELLGSVDRDIAARLQTNIHVFGGTSRLLGFTERFGHELKGLMHENSALQVISHNAKKTATAWVGAAIFAGNEAMAQHWITAADLAETGDHIVDLRLI